MPSAPLLASVCPCQPGSPPQLQRPGLAQGSLPGFLGDSCQQELRVCEGAMRGAPLQSTVHWPAQPHSRGPPRRPQHLAKCPPGIVQTHLASLSSRGHLAGFSEEVRKRQSPEVGRSVSGRTGSMFWGPGARVLHPGQGWPSPPLPSTGSTTFWPLGVPCFPMSALPVA